MRRSLRRTFFSPENPTLLLPGPYLGFFVCGGKLGFREISDQYSYKKQPSKIRHYVRKKTFSFPGGGNCPLRPPRYVRPCLLAPINIIMSCFLANIILTIIVNINVIISFRYHRNQLQCISTSKLDSHSEYYWPRYSLWFHFIFFCFKLAFIVLSFRQKTGE